MFELAVRHRRAAARRRPSGSSASSTAAIGGWTLDGEPYTVAHRQAVRLVPRAHARRPHEPLGTHLAALRAATTSSARASTASATTGRSRYDDIKPYYDKLDRLIGIFGTQREDLPNEPDGIFLPPPKPRCYELLIKKASRQAEHHRASRRGCRSSRKPLNGRPACHYCGQCGRGCATHSNFSSPSVLLPPALTTGKLTIITNAMAREVTVGQSGLATGVSYVDKSRPARQSRARAHRRARGERAARSARLLLNSKSAKLPERPRQLERRASAST